MPISFGDDFDSYECLNRKVEEIEHNFNSLFVIDSLKVVENMNLYHSGLMVAHLPVVQEVPGTNLHCRNFVFHYNYCNLKLWAWAAHFLQCLGRLSLSPSEGR